MPNGDDPRNDEFLKTIKDIERQRFWFPFMVFGFLILYIWMAGGNVFERPTMATAFPGIIVFALVFVGTELLNVKILLIKAEYRDWLREFRKERWTSISSD